MVERCFDIAKAEGSIPSFLTKYPADVMGATEKVVLSGVSLTHKHWVVSSAVERRFYTAMVGGSIPSQPTNPKEMIIMNESRLKEWAGRDVSYNLTNEIMGTYPDDTIKQIESSLMIDFMRFGLSFMEAKTKTLMICDQIVEDK